MTDRSRCRTARIVVLCSMRGRFSESMGASGRCQEIGEPGGAIACWHAVSRAKGGQFGTLMDAFDDRPPASAARITARLRVEIGNRVALKLNHEPISVDSGHDADGVH